MALFLSRRSNPQTSKLKLAAVGALAGAAFYSPAVSQAANVVDVYGVRAAAQELPSIYGMFRRPGDTSGGPLDEQSDSSNAFQAYLDTGTSGIILSQEYTESLGINPELDSNGKVVTFSDVAVNGSVTYNVSEPLTLRLGRYDANVNDLDTTGLTDTQIVAQTNSFFNQVTPNVRVQLNPTPVGDLLDTPLNLIGMPALKSKVMVIDARLYNHLTGISNDLSTVTYSPEVSGLADFPKNSADVPLPQIQTFVYDKGDTTYRSATPLFNPGVPHADHVVKLSYGDFSKYTVTSPLDASPPALDHNPFVGPVPFSNVAPGTPGTPPGITLKRTLSGTSTLATTTGSWLLDTGAQISFMSSAEALSLGVELSFDNNGDPVLTDLKTGLAPDGEFTVALGGAGAGTSTLLGFTVPELDLPTTDGMIVFHNVPIGVLDVTVSDGTHDYTLDGDLGMNLLLPSFDVTTDNATSGQFDFVTFDEAAGELRLTDAQSSVPEPVSISSVGFVAIYGLSRRRVRE